MRRISALLLLLLLLGCEREGPTVVPDRPAAAEVCAGAEALVEIWPPEREAALEAALESVPGEWPAQLVVTIDARLAKQAETWRQTYARACEADDRKAQRCLDVAAWQLDATIELILADPSRAAKLWDEIDTGLGEPDRCEGRDEPSFDAPALDPAVGRQVSQMRLLLNLREYTAVREAADALELHETVRSTPAYAIGVAISRAVVAFAAGDVGGAGEALDQATRLADQLGSRARVSVAQARAFVAFGRGDVEGGMLALDQALAAARDQTDPWLVFDQLQNIGHARAQAGDFAGAVSPWTEAISLSTRLAGVENPHTARAQLGLAGAQLHLDKIEAAYDLLTQARDSFVNTLGPDHPQTLASVEAIGGLLVAANRPGEAQFAYLDLLEIYTELYGPKDVHTARIKLELGDTLMAVDQHDGARTMYTEALNPLVQALGADDRAAIRASIHLGIAELALGHLDEATTHCERGANLVKALPPGDTLASEVQQCVEQLKKARKPKRR